MDCFHTWAPGGVGWSKRCNVQEPLYAFFKNLPKEAEDLIAMGECNDGNVLQMPDVNELGEFSEEIADLTHQIIDMWPKRNAQGAQVPIEISLLAGRVDWILRKVPNVDGELLLDAVRVYLEGKRKRYISPHTFFAADTSTSEALWKSCAKIVRFRARAESEEQNAASAR